ncbi:MAG: VWA domain-containing protein [Acidobacteriia bacterium]|nr:VWA domain-containing protein [Terriglobia bacterium]
MKASRLFSVVTMATAILACLFCGAASAQRSNRTTDQAESPRWRSYSRLVVVDVVVSDGHAPVKGLSKEAFEVFEKGREQTITGFEEHTIANQSQAEKARPLPPHTYSNQLARTESINILLLDALNTPVSDQRALRVEMADYLRSIPAKAPIAVFTLVSRLRLLHGLTADTASLLAALNGAKSPASPSPLLEDQNGSDASVMQADAAEQPLQLLEQFETETTAIHTDLRVQITVDAFKQIARYLSGIPGRKNLIWFSGSFPLSLEPSESSDDRFRGQRVYSDDLRQVGNDLAAARVAVYPVDARGLMPETLFSAAALNSAYGTSTPRSSGRGRALPGGPGAFVHDHSQFLRQTDAEHNSMKQIAEETGGAAFYSTNGFKEALAAALEDGANYYTLTYSPDNKSFDGRFRNITVKLSSGNYRLAYRRGYFARVPELHNPKDADALLSPYNPGIQLGAPPSSQVLFRIRVLRADATSRVQAGPAGLIKQTGQVERYLLDYKLEMPNIGYRFDTSYHLGLELVAIAYDPEGKPLNIANAAFQLHLRPSEYEKLVNEGLPLHQEIDVPVRNAYLRLVVHDLLTDLFGSIEVPLHSSALTAARRGRDFGRPFRYRLGQVPQAKRNAKFRILESS